MNQRLESSPRSGSPVLTHPGYEPKHWEPKRLKTLVEQINEPTKELRPGDVYIALEHVESWTGRVRIPDTEVEFDSQAKRFQVGDILFGKLRPYLAKVTLPDKGGACVGEFLVLRPNPAHVYSPYLARLLRSKPVIDAVDASTFGAKMPRADWRFIGNMVHPLPSVPEQAAIVGFLDHTDGQIQRYIAGKERLIALLEEKRQALIHQAVTRGLDPSVRLKPSGVEWLGEVPEHWEMRRLKQVSAIQTGITIGPTYDDEGLIERPYLRVANVQSDHPDLSKVTTIRASPAEIKRATLEVGDVLMTEGGDIDKLGRGCLWLGEIPDCLHQNHVFAVRPDPRHLNPEFLVALMGSFQARTYFYVTAKQTTNLAATNRTTLGNLPMCLPSADEQLYIIEYITARCRAQDDAIERNRRQINLMNEYRTRLIADVVTGQLDVREANQHQRDHGGKQHGI